MPGAIHGLDRHRALFLHVVVNYILLLFVAQLELGEEHVFQVVVVVTRGVPHVLAQDERRAHLLIVAAAQQRPHEVHQQVENGRTLWVKERETRGLFIEGE